VYDERFSRRWGYCKHEFLLALPILLPELSRQTCGSVGYLVRGNPAGRRPAPAGRAHRTHDRPEIVTQELPFEFPGDIHGTLDLDAVFP